MLELAELGVLSAELPLLKYIVVISRFPRVAEAHTLKQRELCYAFAESACLYVVHTCMVAYPRSKCGVTWSPCSSTLKK